MKFSVKIQSDSDCKIILKAIKWIQKIRNKQATWSWGFVRRCRKVRYRHQAPKKYSLYCFVEREKMNEILMELNLETLAAVFQGEIIVPLVVQSMSNEKIEQLGVPAIGDRVWLRELCKENREQQQVIIWLSKYWKPVNKQNQWCTLSWRCTGGANASSILGVLGRRLKV